MSTNSKNVHDFEKNHDSKKCSLIQKRFVVLKRNVHDSKKCSLIWKMFTNLKKMFTNSKTVREFGKNVHDSKFFANSKNIHEFEKNVHNSKRCSLIQKSSECAHAMHVNI